MWTENKVFREDMERVSKLCCIPWRSLDNKRVLVTGATGLIGYTLISSLLYRNRISGSKIKVTALVRDVERGRRKFSKQLEENANLEFMQGTIEQMPDIDGEIDYIVHAACPTSSMFFTRQPVETISAVVMGTRNMLELAREKQVSGFAFLSSMEVYGEVREERPRKEDDLGQVDLFSPRSSYPEGKRMAENLCCAYAAEYGVPVSAIRLAQTFGPGVEWEDGRVFAYAARCALNGQSICLKTAGTKKNMYLYTMDAVSAILTVMVKGERGSAYNAGNPGTYCSVRELAETAARELGNDTVAVLVNTEPEASGCYRPESFLRLNVEKLEKLGWSAEVNLAEMFHRMKAGFPFISK